MFKGIMTNSSEAAQKSADLSQIYGNIDNLVIDKKVGKGQFSEVFRARNKINGENVALKKIQVSFLGNFRELNKFSQYFVRL